LTSEGRIWKFGDNINTDLIIPGRYLHSSEPAHLRAHAMEGASTEFSSEVGPGDIVLAGANFGCGSSREQAVTALKESGISAVVAQSFARIFYRNAINLGLPVYESVRAYEVFDDGEMAVLDASDHIIAATDGSKKAELKVLAPHIEEILKNGGLLPHIRRKLQS